MGCKIWSTIRDKWEDTQVEFQGMYSTGRVLDLNNYLHGTNWAKTICIVLGIPVPCLVITLLIDFLPMSDPSEGIYANKHYLVREYYAYFATTFLSIHQFRTGVREVLSYPTKRVIRDTILVAAFTIGALYGLILLIGFPLPFATLLTAPIWLTFILIPLFIQWRKGIRENPRTMTMLIDMVKLWICQFSMTLIYPPYYYIFTKLSSSSQMGFTLLLPVIKLGTRNLFARAVGHLGDETLVLVIFNADVFGSLFVSYCMQNSPSIWTTVELMVADMCLIGLSLRDIELARSGLGELEQKVDSGYLWSSYRGSAGYFTLGGRRPTTLERASIILETEPLSPQDNTRSAQLMELKRISSRLPKEIKGPNILLSSKNTSANIRKSQTAGVRVLPSLVLKEVNERGQQTLTRKDKLQYTRKVRQVLYMAEFLLLLNYVEVVIPCIFSIYFVVTYYLPNREYYAIYDDIDEHQLLETLANVMFYCVLQLASLPSYLVPAV